MTLREAIERKQEELTEFFTWRFGTPKFGNKLARLLGVRRARKGVHERSLLMRWEDAAVRLGYRSGAFRERERTAFQELLAQWAIVGYAEQTKHKAKHRNAVIPCLYVDSQGLAWIASQDLKFREAIPMRPPRLMRHKGTKESSVTQLELGLDL